MTKPNERREPPRMGGPAAFMGGPPVTKVMDFKGSLRRILRMLKPERSGLVGVIALGIGSVAMAVAGPKVLGHATDIIFNGIIGRTMDPSDPKLAEMVQGMNVIPGKGIDFDAVGKVLMWALVVYIGASLFQWLQLRMTAGVVQRSMYRLREDVEAKLSRLPLSYFDGQQRGEVLSRATNDVDNLAQTLQQTLAQLITSVLTVVGVLTMMFVISPLLALIALVTVPVSFLLTIRIGKKAQPQFVAQWATTGKLNAHIEEMYSGHALVKVFGRQHEVAEKFKVHNDALYASAFKAQFISSLIQPAMFFIGNINYILVAVVGGLRVASGALTLGDVQAFIQYSRQFSQPLTQIASMSNLVQSGVASAERVFKLLDATEQEPDPVAPARLTEVRGRVAFEGVSFRYQPETPLIENLSLTVEPGQTVAIVGPTGAGKTTLVNLLMRFYDVTGGRITLDGVDIATMTRDDLRSQMGMVLQDTWLFGGTIAENIAYAAHEPTREEVIAAAKASHVDHFVRTLPGGYETVLDEEGGNLSAGEKQLMTIARAVMSEPTILILDEATSSVDTRTEVLIQQAMATLREGRTSFVIAHRLSTIRNADVILVMESGRIVEQGTHEKLLAEGGAYARLYAAQFAQPISDAS